MLWNINNIGQNIEIICKNINNSVKTSTTAEKHKFLMFPASFAMFEMHSLLTFCLVLFLSHVRSALSVLLDSRNPQVVFLNKSRLDFCLKEEIVNFLLFFCFLFAIQKNFFFWLNWKENFLFFFFLDIREVLERKKKKSFDMKKLCEWNKKNRKENKKQWILSVLKNYIKFFCNYFNKKK